MRCFQCDIFDIGHIDFPSILGCGHSLEPHDNGMFFIYDIWEAYVAARSARFEHGESG